MLAPGGQFGALRIERELGHGAFGVVYLAMDTRLERPVALKVVPPPPGGLPDEERERILTEARLLAGLSCPHVVTLFALHEGEDGGFLLEMELVDGGSLEERLEARAQLPLEDSLRVFRGVLTGLEAAHAERIVHGDVKPANVLFGPDDLVELADFGVARLLAGGTTSDPLHGQLAGSPLYMAPEVISGRELGPAADVWAATVVLYQCLTGRYPFPAETFSELLSRVLGEAPEPVGMELPDPVSGVIAQGLARDPSDRPTAAGILAALAEMSGAVPQIEMPEDTVPFLGRDRELQAVDGLASLENGRLVTVTGPPGIGKSRLLREAVRRLAPRFPGGCLYRTVGEASDLEEIADLDRPAGPRLVALDGVDAVVDDAARTVSRVLTKCSATRFLVASRSRLCVTGEQTLSLGPLARSDAEALRERAGEVGAWNPAEDDAFPLAILEGRDALDASLDHAFQALCDWERAALLGTIRLPDGFTLLEAEETIDLSEFAEAPFAMDAVQDLCDRSFVQAGDEDGEVRFRVHRSIRGFARRRLGAS